MEMNWEKYNNSLFFWLPLKVCTDKLLSGLEMREFDPWPHLCRMSSWCLMVDTRRWYSRNSYKTWHSLWLRIYPLKISFPFDDYGTLQFLFLVHRFIFLKIVPLKGTRGWILPASKVEWWRVFRELRFVTNGPATTPIWCRAHQE